MIRVVNLGLPKSGTTTLGHALKVAGLKTADHRIHASQTADNSLHDRYVADLIYRGYFETGDPLYLMPEFQGFSEISTLSDGKSLWPQMDWGVIDAIRRFHPDVKFVATWRDPFDMSQSMLGWSNLGLTRLPNGNLPGLPPGYGQTSSERERWIAGHYAHLRRLFARDPAYLELNIAAPDAREKLASHIGVDLPWWGIANRNRDKGVA